MVKLTQKAAVSFVAGVATAWLAIAKTKQDSYQEVFFVLASILIAYGLVMLAGLAADALFKRTVARMLTSSPA